MIRKFFNIEAGHGLGGDAAQDIHIPKDKAQEFIDSRINGARPEPVQEKQVDLNVDGHELGKSPGDTLDGKITSARYGEEVHARIKNFRTVIDGFYLTAKQLDSFQFIRSRELALAITSFQNARQFCGKLLSERGATYPYPKDGTGQRSEQGQLLTEVMDFTTGFGINATDNSRISVEALAKFRDIVEDLITEFGLFGQHSAVVSWTEAVCHQQIMSGVLSGKMWLGELLAIKAGEKS